MVFCDHCAFSAFICVIRSLDFPLLTLSMRVVLSHDSVKRRLLYIFIVHSTAALSLDNSVGTFSESLISKSDSIQ